MTKLIIAGLASWAGGLLILGFQAISSLMGTEANWENLTLVEIAGPERLEWVDRISWDAIQNMANYIVTMPFYILLFCVGLLLFVIHAFTSKL